MAIAFDAAAELERTNTSDPATWTHTPVGRPMAIVVSAVHGTSSTDHVSTVTYGGVSMARIVRATDTSTEPGAAELWFLGAGIPTGPQTVSADLTSATTDDIHFVSMSFTANCSTESIDFDSINENATNPSVTLNYGGRNAMAVAALYGGGASPASFTPNGNCTAVHDRDLGAFYSTVIRQTSAGTSDFAIGGTASGDDVAYVALALAESDDAPIIYPTGQSVTVGLGTPTVSPYADALIRVGSTSKVSAPLFTPNVRPTGQAVTASLGTPAVTADSSVSPTGYGLTADLGTPVVTGSGTDHEETPTGYGLTAALGTPVVEVVAFPGTLAGTMGLGTPATTADSSVSPTGYGTTADLGTPVEAVTALPTGLEATAALGTVSETVDSTVSPTGLAGTTELGTPSATGGSLVEVSGFGLTADLGTPAATSDAVAVSPSGYEVTVGLGTPTVGAVDGSVTPPTVPYGEPISPPGSRRRKAYQEPEPVKPAEVRQDAMVAVSGFAVSARVGTTWQVADATIAPAGFQCHAQSSPARATGMHNPTDEQIVEWLIQALSASV